MAPLRTLSSANIASGRQRMDSMGHRGVRSGAFMPASTRYSLALVHCFRTIHKVLVGLCRFLVLTARSHSSLAAENLFLRKQFALFQERKLTPHRADDSTRWLMAFLSRVFDWRAALVVVKPDTLIRWQRQGFRLFWR